MAVSIDATSIGAYPPKIKNVGKTSAALATVLKVNQRDLVLVGIPKIGKGTILGAFTREQNAIVLDMEKGGYEYIDARKISTYEDDLSSDWDSFASYIKWRNLLLEDPGKYEYLIIDGLSDCGNRIR